MTEKSAIRGNKLLDIRSRWFKGGRVPTKGSSATMSFAVRFVEEISTVRMEAVFNPYRDKCDVFDRVDAPGIRRKNLVAYLTGVQKLGLDTAWLGRDLGYRGGRRTGLALTDEARLPLFESTFACGPIRQATLGSPLAERTAAQIWAMINQLREPPFLWNVFPFHPFIPGEPMSNRSHTSRERDDSLEVVESVLNWLKPRRVVALGKVAHQTLTNLGYDCTYVRHPSHGGSASFVAGIRRLYGTVSSL